MFCNITSISTGNVNALTGNVDAYSWNANAVGTTLSLPTLTPAIRVTMTANYTGLIPPGFVGGTTVEFNLTFVGWASMTA